MKRLAPLVAVALMLLPVGARADVPIIRDGPTTFTSAGALKSLTLIGQSTCAMVLSGTGSATITPQGSSDGGVTWVTVPTIGVQTANGTYGGAISPYLTTFRVVVSGVTGTVLVSEACSAAVVAPVNMFGGVSDGCLALLTGALTSTLNPCTTADSFDKSCTITAPATTCSVSFAATLNTYCVESLDGDPSASGTLVVTGISVSAGTWTDHAAEIVATTTTVTFHNLCVLIGGK